ncbi:MAG TPA: hypothetical protein VE074_13735 [Jatrophihabitantaceae bacterium]|nr:hypothetical protein [Jatrophihabitantaceae bacterium]
MHRAPIALAAAGSALVLGLAVGAPSAGATTTDTTPPTTPTGLHQLDPDAPASVSTLAWNASTDTSGAIAHYWVRNLDLGNRSRPVATSMHVSGLLYAYCATVPKTIHVAVQAVDAAGNLSAYSAPILVQIN